MRQHKLFWGSSYDRGLDVLLLLWEDVKKKFPDAELHICYGWTLFDKVTANNAERQEWKKSVQRMMEQPGITHHGRLGKKELAKVRKSCGIWAYPTYFEEIHCINALEAQADGLVPVTMDLAALDETVQSGFKVKGDIKDPKVFEEYKARLLEMMGDEELWKYESKEAFAWANMQTWSSVASYWKKKIFKEQEELPLVTIYTPTVREGFWNIMAANISSQTYKNIEWIIVDDSGVDRSNLAKKYGRKYNLDIRYMSGKKRNVKRTYSLCNANNTAIEKAQGEVFVFLQDFVLMPLDGIEKIVDLYKHHPNDFLAVCDKYYSPKLPPNVKNAEDWFKTSVDVVGQFIRKNIRIKNIGIRESEVITDFEQNYGAVATKVLRELGGYYEFFDEALGWDDTEIIYRAWKKGHKLIVDDTNVAICIDHWGTLGKDEGGKSVNRVRRMNDPRYLWMVEQIEKGKLPLVRTQEIDDKINLQYEIPANIPDEQCGEWIAENRERIAKSWM